MRASRNMLERFVLIGCLVACSGICLPRGTRVASAGALVLWPNCVSPGDTVWVKSGSWPAYGPRPYQAFRIEAERGASEPQTTFYQDPMHSHTTQFRYSIFVGTDATLGTRTAAVTPVGCTEPPDEGGGDCYWIPESGPNYCRLAPLTI